MTIKVINKETKEEQIFKRVANIRCGAAYNGRSKYPFFEFSLITKEFHSVYKSFDSNIYTFELVEHKM